MAKIPPFGLTTAQIRDELAAIRHDVSVAVIRAKNPFNVGSIIRTAHSFLVREIFLVGTEPFYEKAEWKAWRSDPEADPFADAENLVYQPGWTGGVFREMAFIIRVMTLDTHDELVDAWRAINAFARGNYGHRRVRCAGQAQYQR